jgi:hypothetical protein
VVEDEALLREIAARYVWWQSPDAALARPRHLLCQIMTLGTAEDVRSIRSMLGDAVFVDALDHAPPGVMDAKSWNYWRLFFGRPTAPLPERPLP